MLYQLPFRFWFHQKANNQCCRRLFHKSLMLEAQPSNHFIKAAGDKNLSRELERMYRVFKVLQNLQKFGGLS